MKKFLALVLLMGLLSTNLFAVVKNIRSSDKKAQIHVARVVKLLNFPKESGVVINIAVVDTGGSTDVSASKDIYFTLYKRGEMFSTDASFFLGSYISLISAKKIAPYRYEIFLEGLNKEYSFEKKHYIIDIKNAFDALQKVDCGDEFDCSASTSFQTSITISNDEKYLDSSIKKEIGSPLGIVYGLDSRGDGFLSIRTKPNSQEIGRLYNGSEVEILDQKNSWYKVKDVNSEKIGWAYNKWIKVQ